MKPEMSIIVCTYNGGALLKKCVDSILSQSYTNYEIIFIDGGSSDGTINFIKEIIKKNKKAKLIFNKKRLPEGRGMGKWLGCKKARGKIVGIVDQDNILQRKDFFSYVSKIINNNPNLLTISAGLKNDIHDPHVTRYISLVGTDSFFSYRSLDFLRRLDKKNKNIEYYKAKLDNMMLIGSNCIFYSKRSLNEVGGYDRDIVVNENLLLNKKDLMVAINNATKHYSDKNLYRLAIKKFMWGKNYFNTKNSTDKYNYLPKTKLEFNEFLKNLIFNLLIIPNFYYASRIYSNSKDPIAFIFPYMAFSNTIAYGLTFLFGKIREIKIF